MKTSILQLGPVVAMGIAIGVAGCQASSPRPAQAPAASAMPPPSPPSPWSGGEAGMMAHHHDECPGGCEGHHEGAGTPEREQADDERMAGQGRRGRGDMMGGRGQRSSGAHWGGGHAAMRELAALGVRLYPAQMLLRRAPEIGLTPDQVTKIRQEMFATQGRAVDLMAKVGHAKIEIARSLSADKVDEHAVDAQIDEAAKAGAEMHKLRVGALLRIRALLTPEQRQKLDERKPRREGAKVGATPGHMPEPIGDRDDDEEEDEEDDWGG